MSAGSGGRGERTVTTAVLDGSGEPAVTTAVLNGSGDPKVPVAGSGSSGDGWLKVYVLLSPRVVESLSCCDINLSQNETFLNLVSISCNDMFWNPMRRADVA